MCRQKLSHRQRKRCLQAASYRRIKSVHACLPCRLQKWQSLCLHRRLRDLFGNPEHTAVLAHARKLLYRAVFFLLQQNDMPYPALHLFPKKPLRDQQNLYRLPGERILQTLRSRKSQHLKRKILPSAQRIHQPARIRLLRIANRQCTSIQLFVFLLVIS